jgi:[glutamine synthetase] adenylyltransferase / [glutamine synthetase]-adenylyl-L-tyrosine phosphorylase
MSISENSLTSRIVRRFPVVESAFWESFSTSIPSAARPLLETMADSSIYLRDLLLKFPTDTAHMLCAVPEDELERLCEQCRTISAASDLDEVRRNLRIMKSRVALLVALADISGVWTLEEVTNALTRFADTATQTALDVLLRQASNAGKFNPRNSEAPSEGCGYTILAMGKHGAHELNYSSDIDLIVLYDPEIAPLADGVEPSTFFVRLTRSLVALLQDMTEDGYVLRVDLRLRPDPRATQVAIAVEAAAVYYEYQGQNWERAAMIKARAAAGDITLGEGFLDRLKPYIWRRYLDFAAIADVQSLKRQIHAVKGHGSIAINGHNLKLGRGGIREIEFFVQTQQLIAGGRTPQLRGRQTLSMLAALADAGWITPAVRDDMTDAYRLLRMLEHRVQMLRDQQDHCLPTTDEELVQFSILAGFSSSTELRRQLQAVLETVQRHYQALFETAGELASDTGNLVFTGGEDDPGTIETLKQLGFLDASEVSATIRGWHFGRYPATRTARSRELLTELMPQLLKTLAETGDAGQAFIAFDAFLRGLPAGVQLFSMLKANPQLLELIARILGTAPRLAAQLSRQPRILEAVLEPGFFGPFPTSDELHRLANAVLPDGLPLEECMDRARTLGREQMFRIGVRVLSETLTAAEAGNAYANVADTLLVRLHRAVTQDMVSRHGDVVGGDSAIIAMGKLGGREMTASSDLDLILVYDHKPDAENSDGLKPLSVQQYFSRLTQRLLTAITAPTAEGILYEADMRLRPSGSKGPVAVSLPSFIEYQRNSAWTWEKLALTRARVVSASPALRVKIESAISEALTRNNDHAAVCKDARDMRQLMLREHQSADRWDIKRKRGGLVDIEFIAQTLQLSGAEQQPAILKTNTREALIALMEAGALDKRDGAHLVEAHRLYSALTQVLRLCLEREFDPISAPLALHRLLAGAAMQPSLAATEALLDERAAEVSEIFGKIIG